MRWVCGYISHVANEIQSCRKGALRQPGFVEVIFALATITTGLDANKKMNLSHGVNSS